MNIALRTKAEDMTGHRKWTSHTRFGKFVLEDHRYFTVYKNSSPLCFDGNEAFL